MDFGSLKRPSAHTAPTDPIEIFKRTPNLDEALNDLWAGQSEALTKWNAHRNDSDVLIALNTGAGKSIVGLLIAQSLINERGPKVVYVCATNDLIHQTEKEAKKLGLKFSVRMEQSFSNDLYETERAFCITNYSSLFNAFTPFRGNKQPTAVIFDDAHVAEKYVRDALTINILRRNNPELFSKLIGILAPAFDQVGRKITLEQTLQDANSAPILVPTFASAEFASQISAELNIATKPRDAEFGLKSGFVALKDFIQHCCILISGSTIELSPPFVPTAAFPILNEAATRRIYLSATLKSKADFVRTFGREPSRTIEPENDAGNGERLILFHKFLPQDLTGPVLAERFAKQSKILIAVPGTRGAHAYKDVAIPPKRAEFSFRLDAFRAADHGAFVLVYRVDGIDLPHKTCRIMLIDGLPTGSSLLERYQWADLSMRNLFNGRIANRLTQLFGRINRGRSDYGVFLIVGRDINTWLDTDRFMSLLPDLIHRQILLGRNAVESNVPKDFDHVVNIVDAVLRRDDGWLTYYRDWIDGVEINEGERIRAANLESGFVAIAKAEVEFANKLWAGDSEGAKDSFIRVSESAAILDAKVAGWHALWVGHCFDFASQYDTAQEYYELAKSRLSPRLPIRRLNVRKHFEEIDDAETFLESFISENLEFGVRHVNDLIAKIRANCSQLLGGALTSRQAEEAVRTLGSFLGFEATRPDNELGKGPDVLWVDGRAKVAIPLELKTDKKEPATYRKKDDIGQAHDGLEWLAENYNDHHVVGYIFLGPFGKCSKDAHPSDEMYLCSPSRLSALLERYISLLDDIKLRLPLERSAHLKGLRANHEWQAKGIAAYLFEWPMKSLKVEET